MTTQHRTHLKSLKTRRKDLCHARDVWNLRAPNVLHFDYTIGCNEHAKPDPYCEGCGMTLYRGDRLAEIAAAIKAVDIEITNITGEPYMTARPKQAKPVQAALF